MATTNFVAEQEPQAPAPSPLEQQRQGERAPALAQAAPPLAGPSPAPPAAEPSLEALAAQQTAQAQTLYDAYIEGMKSANEKYDKASEDMRNFLQRRSEALQPEREAYREVVGRPNPKVPEVPAVTPLPATGARPFLEGLPGESTTTSLQRMLTGLSLIAQMGVGIGTGYSRGALAAYTGALEGWQQGDRQRAENEWAQYLQQVAAMQRDYKNRHRAYTDIIEANKWDEQKMRLALGMRAAEFGEEQQAIELAFKDADAFRKRNEVTGAMAAKLQHDAANTTTKLVLQRQKDAHDLELKKLGIESAERIAEANRQNHLAVAELKANAKGQKLLGNDAAKWENTTGERPLPTMTMEEATIAGFRPIGKQSVGDTLRTAETLLNQLDALVPKLAAKGFLSTSPGRVAHEQARMKRFLFPDDPDYRAWKAHEGTMVSIGRSLGDNIRALGAHESAMGIIRHPTSAAGATEAFAQLREALLAGKPKMAPAQAESGPVRMQELPDPTQYAGKIFKNPQTGQRMQSNGDRWVPLGPRP